MEKQVKPDLESTKKPENPYNKQALVRLTDWFRGQVAKSPVMQFINSKKAKEVDPRQAAEIKKNCQNVITFFMDDVEGDSVATLQEVWDAVKEPFLAAQSSQVDVIDIGEQVPVLLKKVAEKWLDKTLLTFREIENPEEDIMITTSGLLEIVKTVNLIKELGIQIDTSVIKAAEPRLIAKRVEIVQVNINAVTEGDKEASNLKEVLSQELNYLAALGVDVSKMRSQLESAQTVDMNSTTGFIFQGRFNGS